MNEINVVNKLLTPETSGSFKLGAKEFADNLASNVNAVVQENENELLDRIESQLEKLDNEQSANEPQTIKQNREKLMKYHYAIKNDMPVNMNNRISVISDTHGDALALLAPYVESGAVKIIPGKYNYVDIASGEVYDSLDDIPNHENIFSEKELNTINEFQNNFITNRDKTVDDLKPRAFEAIRSMVMNNQASLDSILEHKDEILSLKSDIKSLSSFNGQSAKNVNTHNIDVLQGYLSGSGNYSQSLVNRYFGGLKKFMSPEMKAKSLSEILSDENYKSELQETLGKLKNQVIELNDKENTLDKIYKDNCNIEYPTIKETFTSLIDKALDNGNNQTRDDILKSMTSDENIDSVISSSSKITDTKHFHHNFSTELLKTAYPASNIVALPALEKVPGCNAQIFHLGDLIDRGAENIPSLCLALQLKKKLGDQARFIAGNHEISANDNYGTTHYHSALKTCFDKKLFEPSVKVETKDGNSTYFGHCVLTKEELPIMFQTFLATQISDDNLEKFSEKKDIGRPDLVAFKKFKSTFNKVLEDPKYNEIRPKIDKLLFGSTENKNVDENVKNVLDEWDGIKLHNYLCGENSEFGFNDDDLFLMRDAFIDTQMELYKSGDHSNAFSGGIEKRINNIFPGFVDGSGPFFIAARTKVNERNKLSPKQDVGHTPQEDKLTQRKNVTYTDLARGYGYEGGTLISAVVLDSNTCIPVYEDHNSADRDKQTNMLMPEGKIHKREESLKTGNKAYEGNSGIDLREADEPYIGKNGEKEERKLNSISKKLLSRWSAETIDQVQLPENYYEEIKQEKNVVSNDEVVNQISQKPYIPLATPTYPNQNNINQPYVSPFKLNPNQQPVYTNKNNINHPPLHPFGPNQQPGYPVQNNTGQPPSPLFNLNPNQQPNYPFQIPIGNNTFIQPFNQNPNPAKARALLSELGVENAESIPDKDLYKISLETVSEKVKSSFDNVIEEYSIPTVDCMVKEMSDRINREILLKPEFRTVTYNENCLKFFSEKWKTACDNAPDEEESALLDVSSNVYEIARAKYALETIYGKDTYNNISSGNHKDEIRSQIDSIINDTFGTKIGMLPLLEDGNIDLAKIKISPEELKEKVDLINEILVDELKNHEPIVGDYLAQKILFVPISEDEKNIQAIDVICNEVLSTGDNGVYEQSANITKQDLKSIKDLINISPSLQTLSERENSQKPKAPLSKINSQNQQTGKNPTLQMFFNPIKLNKNERPKGNGEPI